MKSLKEKSTIIKIGGKEYILSFKKSLFVQNEYTVELLKEKGKHEILVSVGVLYIEEENE